MDVLSIQGVQTDDKQLASFVPRILANNLLPLKTALSGSEAESIVHIS